MLLLVVIYLSIIVLGIHVQHENASVELWFNKDVTQCIRGMCALIIFLGHLPEMMTYLNPNYKIPAYMGAFSGCLGVAVFFFLSGYGLSLSKSGLKHFFRKRFLKVFIPYIICNIIYYAVVKVFSGDASVIGFIRSWGSGNPQVPYSWYIIVQLIFYICFYLSRLVPRKYSNSALFVFLVAYTVLTVKIGWTSVNYHESFCFVLGCICADHIEAIYNRCKKHVVPIAIILLAISIILYQIYLHNLRAHFTFLDMSGLFVCMFILIINMKIQVVNSVLKFMGKISLEIYMYQGLVMRVLKQIMLKLNFTNVQVYAIGSVFLTIVIAACIHWGTARLLPEKLIYKDQKHAEAA